LLIAEREFAHVATFSFWLSLAIAPLGAIGVLLSGHQPPPALVRSRPKIGRSPSRQDWRWTKREQLEGRSFVFGQGGARVSCFRESRRFWIWHSHQTFRFLHRPRHGPSHDRA
jgi:hypothetical protein